MDRLDKEPTGIADGLGEAEGQLGVVMSLKQLGSKE